MGEGQVSVDGERRDLSELFFVIATQNPVEFRGTYPLPEAQMDRFAMQFTLGYVEPDDEVKQFSPPAGHNHPLELLEPCVTLKAERAAPPAWAIEGVRVSEELKHYAVALGGRDAHCERRATGRQPARLDRAHERSAGAGLV